MGFLTQPDERRLWLVIATLLGLAIVLLFASIQSPWYSARFEAPGVTFDGEFDLNEGHYEIQGPGMETIGWSDTYPGDNRLGDMMGRTGLLVGIGTFGAVALAVLLFVHHRGWFTKPALIATAWILGVGGIAAGITYFTLTAADATAQELERLAQAFDLSVRPEPVFWGTQTIAGGELSTAPGVGWLLAKLGLLNLAGATLLVYQFPSHTAAAAGAAEAPARPTGGPRDESSAGPEAPAVTAHSPFSRS